MTDEKFKKDKLSRIELSTNLNKKWGKKTDNNNSSTALWFRKKWKINPY